MYYPQAQYGYQSNYPAQNLQQNNQLSMQQNQPQNNQGLIWVSGEVGAKSYLMAPNSTVMLMDSEEEKFYIKSTDMAGMPSIRAYSYTECLPDNAQALNKALNNASEQFVTRSEYEALMSKYEDIINEIKELKKPKTQPRKKEVTEE